MGTLSPIHWIVLLLVALLLFGPTRLANIGKGLGEGIRNFKKGIESGDDEHKDPAQLPAASKDAPRPNDSGVS
ncbi:MAG TPA: twin-arginine translocase TatA/TatE family subunit [Polyangiaceae bacterium]|nr:twin-arginine translocase TatA/TatE family subunit [Polyangiaceae bacterium]